MKYISNDHTNNPITEGKYLILLMDGAEFIGAGAHLRAEFIAFFAERLRFGGQFSFEL
jgi:hypothetical protein